MAMEEDTNTLYQLIHRICYGDMTYYYLMLCHGVHSDNVSLLSYQDLKEIGIDEVGTRRTIFSEIESRRLDDKKQKRKISKPIQPPVAFQLFLRELRAFQPGNFAAVNQSHCRKWMAMSIKEKAPFVAMAKKLRDEYERDVEAYNLQMLDLTGNEGDASGNKGDEYDESKWDVVNEDECCEDSAEGKERVAMFSGN